MLMAQMLRDMKEGLTSEAPEAGLGADRLGDTLTVELAQWLSASGGLGLAEMLQSALAKRDRSSAEPQGPSERVASLPGAADADVHTVARAADMRAAGPTVSSPYGWRSDPVDGRHRFHAGMDVRVAYGHEVRAGAPGVVRFAGERAGYGLLVVVDHGEGMETRYAHLSSVQVDVGATVEAGQVIARSGNSGRTTGAHLHFEVRKDGRPLDPAAVAGLVPVVGPREPVPAGAAG
jgi:murein DD-endopeptidase MepM/ murein hydrolase activator NlpD